MFSLIKHVSMSIPLHVCRVLVRVPSPPGQGVLFPDSTYASDCNHMGAFGIQVLRMKVCVSICKGWLIGLVGA